MLMSLTVPVNDELVLVTARSNLPSPLKSPAAEDRGTKPAPKKVAAGQTVVVSQGTYVENVTVPKSGTATAPIGFAAVDGAEVVVTGQIHGFTITAKVEVQNGAIKFGGLGLPGGLGGGLNVPGGLSIPGLSLPIPRAPLLPCSTQSANVIQGRIRVSCTITQIPKELFKTDLLSLGG